MFILSMLQRVGRFEVNQDMVYISNLYEFLRYSYSLGMTMLGFPVSLSLSALDLFELWKGPVWVATGLKWSPDVLLFFPLPLCHFGHEQQVLTCVCRFSVHLNIEASVFFSVYCTVQEGQTVSSYISLFEPDVIIYSIYMFWEDFFPLK